MRPRPCSPGGYIRRSTAHLSVRQRSPLRKSLTASRRHCLHCGDVSFATWTFLDPATLTRTAPVVRYRRHVFDTDDLEAGGLERAYRGLAARARPAHEDLYLLKAVIHALLGTGLGRDLGGEGRALARTLEADRSGALPRDDVALLVGERHQRVVERRLDVRLAHGDVLADPAALTPFGSLRLSHSALLLRLLSRSLLALTADRPLRTLARTGVGTSALPVHRHATTVADALVAADVHEPLDVLRALAPQIALDRDVAGDRVAQPHDLFFGEVADLGVGVDAHYGQDLVGRGPADAVDVREPDLDPLLRRDVDACDTCHADLPLPLTMPRIRADHLDRAMTADDLALLAHRLD